MQFRGLFFTIRSVHVSGVFEIGYITGGSLHRIANLYMGITNTSVCYEGWQP